MGKVLQIRVSAWTYSEDEVKKTWPNLWRLMWEDGGDAIRSKGVMELAKAVHDAGRAGLIPEDAAAALKEKAAEVEVIRLKIEKALNDREPKVADSLSYEIEDCLDALEDIADKF
ncbi:hypothetical protein [Pseudodesulfovibrio sediminis]|uniref:HPt domain-containing protein n=1 Tax=Pseudodesulfovibrio sediminis TaxID=2810563 RepID=A0ABM7P289_9BACT|nr:hypothetical protein [Pseudodesulfovibrio sediminis]BCS86894.1 hypothetical protein PSDVSF_01360 [Pseudodesulfovibrio sediminis]